MEAVAQQGVLFPVIEQRPSALRTFYHAMDAATKEHGPMIPRAWLTTVLDLSKQRIHVLVHEGRIPTIDVEGREMVPMIALDAFLTEERKAGRPVKEFTMTERLGDAWRLYRQRRKDSQK